MLTSAPRLCLVPVLLMGLAACTVGPDYKKPDTTDITPATWRHQPGIRPAYLAPGSLSR